MLKSSGIEIHLVDNPMSNALLSPARKVPKRRTMEEEVILAEMSTLAQMLRY